MKLIFITLSSLLTREFFTVSGLAFPHPAEYPDPNKVQPTGEFPEGTDNVEFQGPKNIENSLIDDYYQYSKEDFADQMKEFEALLQDHMQGLQEAESEYVQNYTDPTTANTDANLEEYTTKDQWTTTEFYQETESMAISTESTIMKVVEVEDDTTYTRSSPIITTGTTPGNEVQDTDTSQSTLASTKTTVARTIATTTPSATRGDYVDIPSTTWPTKPKQIIVSISTEIILTENEYETTSIKSLFSSSGAKINQVEKRLSHHGDSSSSSAKNRNGKSQDDKRSKYSSSRNEINGFIAEIKQQTLLIVFGCIMSIIILGSLVCFAYRILNRLHETTNVALIRHSEHPDVLPSHQQYQVQKLLIKQQMQEEKVAKQKLLLQQLSDKSECKKSKKVYKVRNESPMTDCIELQKSYGFNKELGQVHENKQESKPKCNADRSQTKSNQSSYSSVNLACSSSSSSLKTHGRNSDECLNTNKHYNYPGQIKQFHCVDIIIENGNCLDCIEAVQKKSSESYNKESENTTITYHLGEGVCNDHNHNG